MHQAGDHGHRLTDAEHLELRRQIAGGATHAAAAAALHCSTKTVQQLLIRTGGLAPRDRSRAPLRLSLGEREGISRGLQVGESCRTIAGRIHRAPSTVSREVVRSAGLARYRAWRADKAALRRARRPEGLQAGRQRPLAIGGRTAARAAPDHLLRRERTEAYKDCLVRQLERLGHKVTLEPLAETA